MIVLLCFVFLLALDAFLLWHSQMPDPQYNPLNDYNAEDAFFIDGQLAKCKNIEHLATVKNMIETLRHNYRDIPEAIWDYDALMVKWRLKRRQITDFPEVDKLIAKSTGRIS